MSPRSRGLTAELGVLGLLLAFPLVANDFWVMHVAGRTFGFGTIVLSLVFLVAYTGMLSLAQMTIAGVAGYALAYCTAPAAANAGVALAWPVAVPFALGCAVLASLSIGFVAVRTGGIYTLMITLAIAMGVYYLALQNYAVFNGFTGFTQVPAPAVLGVSFERPRAFYYLCLAVAAVCFALVRYLVQTPFGLALQAVRDNPRRLRALGYPIGMLRVLAFGVAGFIAGLGGILNLWLNGSISPGSVGIVSVTDVLIAAVLGGLRRPIGAYVGAFVLTVLQSFAIEFVAPERFNTIIGLVFIAVVVFSPDGIVGMWSLARGTSRIAALKSRAANTSTALDGDRVQETGGNTHDH
jgi:branched-chain amino acid transport system permease protein